MHRRRGFRRSLRLGHRTWCCNVRWRAVEVHHLRGGCDELQRSGRRPWQRRPGQRIRWCRRRSNRLWEWLWQRRCQLERLGRLRRESTGPRALRLAGSLMRRISGRRARVRSSRWCTCSRCNLHNLCFAHETCAPCAFVTARVYHGTSRSYGRQRHNNMQTAEDPKRQRRLDGANRGNAHECFRNRIFPLIIGLVLKPRLACDPLLANPSPLPTNGLRPMPEGRMQPVAIPEAIECTEGKACSDNRLRPKIRSRCVCMHACSDAHGCSDNLAALA